MTPGARLSAAIEICQGIDDAQAPADRVIGAYFNRRRYAGSKDRRAVINRVYRILRHHARIGWWIDRAGLDLKHTSRVRLIADLVLNEKMPVREIEGLFNGSRHCPDALREPEKMLAAALSGCAVSCHADMPRHVGLEFPRWMESGLRQSFGDGLNDELAALNMPAPVDVRVNRLKATLEDARDALAREGIEAAPTGLCPTALRLGANPRLGGSPAFRQGMMEVQDEGSQIVALLTGAAPGMHVIDFCAGAGGKTLALADCMAHGRTIKGTLVACDVSSRRLDRMQARLGRAGVKGVRTKVLAGQAEPWMRTNAGTADRVLVDVPCTGTGTWRREPDAKWRLIPADLERAIETQQQILARAQGLVNTGGWLVYATCSVLTAENEERMDRFLSEYPNFRALNITDVWGGTIGGECPCTGPWLRLSPATTRTDGFFCAVLERMA